LLNVSPTPNSLEPFNLDQAFSPTAAQYSSIRNSDLPSQNEHATSGGQHTASWRLNGSVELREGNPKPEGPLAGLEGLRVNRNGYVVDKNGNTIGEIVEGNPRLPIGLAVDEDGDIVDKYGSVKGHAELVWGFDEALFAGFEGLRVIEDGYIADENSNTIGEIIEGNPKRLIGLAVDGDGDILDKHRNIKGHAEPIPEEAEEGQQRELERKRREISLLWERTSNHIDQSAEPELSSDKSMSPGLKLIYGKGMFGVSKTSIKPLPFIRADIIRR
jgi:hypothetical protein